ncbi:MAG: homoserine kinase [Gemmatimonadota bacterium]
MSRAAANAPSIRVFAPGSVGNVGPGLDILGLAVSGAGDRVEATMVAGGGITILDAGHPELPTDPAANTAGLAAHEVRRRSGASSVDGIALRVTKGLPLSGGQGGSAASAVAAAVAVNELLGRPLDTQGLLEACLAAEEIVAGRHADNLAPSLLGGLVLIRSIDPLEVVRIPVPDNLFVVLASPAQRLRTVDARAVLPETVSRAVALHQAAQVGAMVAAALLGDLRLFGRAIDDRIAEPARAPLLPGFIEAKRAALEAGALGSSISGSGPTAFALAAGRESAQRIAEAMVRAYGGRETCKVRVAEVDRIGARVES